MTSVDPRASTTDALPSPGPALVLVHADDPAHQRLVTDLAAESATALDLRSGVAWIEVADGLAFLDRLLARLDRTARGMRVAFAPPAVGADELVARAVLAEDIRALRAKRELEQFTDHPVEYTAHFQPVVDLSDGATIGFESLIRASADGLAISAESLIGSAQEGGWLARLDRMARRVALEAVGDWLGDRLLFLNIMAPGGAFDIEDAAACVAVAAERGIAADQLVFEAAERNRYPDMDRAAEQLEQLRGLGARVAVDDVADGYASLLLVSHFRPEVVKLTGDLVQRVAQDTTTSVISAVVRFAHDNGSWVVAEGVETEAQADILRGLDVDWAQGHLFGSPQPPPD